MFLVVAHNDMFAVLITVQYSSVLDVFDCVKRLMFTDKVRVGITNGMPSSVFREITRHPSVLDLQHRKLIIFVSH